MCVCFEMIAHCKPTPSNLILDFHNFSENLISLFNRECERFLKKSPFRLENTNSSLKKSEMYWLQMTSTTCQPHPLSLTPPPPILELWPDFFGLTSAILCALLGYKLYGTWYFDQYYHRLCGMHWARAGPYHRWICKRFKAVFGSVNVRFETNFGSANVLRQVSDP